MVEQVVLVALVGIGLAYTAAKLAGPFGLLLWLKGVLLNAPWLPAWLRNGVECVYCWAFWLTLGATLALVGIDQLDWFVQVWLAAYGLAVVVFLWARL